MTSFVEIGSTVLEKKSFEGFLPYNMHGCHLGYVTWTIYLYFSSHFLRMFHMKFGFDPPSGFREDVGNILVLYIYTALGQGQTTPWRLFFININLQFICLLSASFPPFNYILPDFPIQMHWRHKLTLP